MPSTNDFTSVLTQIFNYSYPKLKNLYRGNNHRTMTHGHKYYSRMLVGLRFALNEDTQHIHYSYKTINAMMVHRTTSNSYELSLTLFSEKYGSQDNNPWF